MDRETHDILMTKLIVRAWQDPEFKQKLLSEPMGAMVEMGIPVEKKAGTNITPVFVENTASKKYFIIPEKPKSASLEEIDLMALAKSEQLILPVCDRS